MLTASLPFKLDQHYSVQHHIHKIQTGLTETHMAKLADISIEGRRLVCKMICVDVKQRINIQQILQVSKALNTSGNIG